MSAEVTRVVSVSCDYPECWAHEKRHDATVAEVRKAIARIGWQHRAGRDYCAEHADHTKTIRLPNGATIERTVLP